MLQGPWDDKRLPVCRAWNAWDCRSAGFAVGAPFGGVPGFITGMAGGFVGEQAARLLAKGLVHMPTPFGKLGTLDDPIAKAAGLPPRKIVRDPDDTAMNEKLMEQEAGLAEKREAEFNQGDETLTDLKIGDKNGIDTVLKDLRTKGLKI